MNLAFAIKGLNVPGGGAERVLALVANEMVARGHKVSVITFDGPGQSFYEIDPRIQRYSLAVGRPGKPTPPFALLRALPRIRAAVKSSGADLVVGFMHSTYVPLAAGLWGLDVPLIASEHAGQELFQSRRLERWLVGAFSRRFVAKTVPSEEIKAQCVNSDACPIHVLPNPLHLEHFALGLTEAPTIPPVVLAVGRFSGEKNQAELIDAFAMVSSEFPDWILRFAGDGVLRPELEQRVARLGLSGRVQMPGAVPAIAREYAAASIVAMPSLWESFGLATAEALASARPVIGFADCPGTNELIEDGTNGVLVEGGEQRVCNLAVGLRRLMADAILRERLGAQGPDSVARFRSEEIIPAWESVFTQYAFSRRESDAVAGS